MTVHFQWFPVQKAEQPVKEKQIQFEFVEAPKVPPAKPKKARFLSTQNSEAANPEKLGKPGNQPSAKGNVPVPELPQAAAMVRQSKKANPSEAKAKGKTAEKIPETEALPLFSSRRQTYETFSPEKLTGTKPQPMTPASNLSYENEEFNVDKMGGMAFNTYEWDFAPYMLYLKRRIQQNIFPPPAFTRLGLIDGHTLLRFRIYPDGRLGNVELINYKGHKTLMQTSMNAVEISAPFKPLPKAFPKDYLEVTGSFWYVVKK